MQKNLGSAEIVISIDNSNGIVIRHGSDTSYVLARKPADECVNSEWDALWTALENLGIKPTVR